MGTSRPCRDDAGELQHFAWTTGPSLTLTISVGRIDWQSPNHHLSPIIPVPLAHYTRRVGRRLRGYTRIDCRYTVATTGTIVRGSVPMS